VEFRDLGKYWNMPLTYTLVLGQAPSINQFIAIAVAEKISALETEQLFVERAKQANLDAFRDLLFRQGGEPPPSGDELS
jgi:hypothetical protein